MFSCWLSWKLLPYHCSKSMKYVSSSHKTDQLYLISSKVFPKQKSWLKKCLCIDNKVITLWDFFISFLTISRFFFFIFNIFMCSSQSLPSSRFLEWCSCWFLLFLFSFFPYLRIALNIHTILFLLILLAISLSQLSKACIKSNLSECQLRLSWNKEFG